MTMLYIIGFSLLILICSCGLLGNAIVIIVGIVRRKYENNATNCYIMSLALSDFLFLFASVPFTMYLAIKKGWIFGEFICKMYIYLAHVLLQVTCYTLATMSVDRYLNIVHETWFRSYRKAKNVRMFCIFIWILSGILTFPYDYMFHIFDQSKGNQSTMINDCTVNNDSVFSSCIFSFGFYYLLPLLVIGLCYSRILIHVRRNGCNVVKHLSGQPRRSIIFRNRRVQRMLLALTLAFALCWLPIHILEMLNCFQLLDDSFYVNHTEELDAARLIAHGLSYFNSCLNPFLYALLNQGYFSSHQV